jgi:hypothetical protein
LMNNFSISNDTLISCLSCFSDLGSMCTVIYFSFCVLIHSHQNKMLF